MEVKEERNSNVVAEKALVLRKSSGILSISRFNVKLRFYETILFVVFI